MASLCSPCAAVNIFAKDSASGSNFSKFIFMSPSENTIIISLGEADTTCLVFVFVFFFCFFFL